MPKSDPTPLAANPDPRPLAIVQEAFEGHSKGDLIRDAGALAAIQGGPHALHVLILPTPDAAER